MAERVREIDTIIRERGSPGARSAVAEVKSLKVKETVWCLNTGLWFLLLH